MTLIRALVGRHWARACRLPLTTTATTELGLDGHARVRHLNKRDAVADSEPEAAMERLRGGELFSDPYPPGSLLGRLSDLLEKSEAGDGVARAELDSVVESLKPSDKLLFYRLREQFMASQMETLRPEEIPPPASDEAWHQVMADAVPRFQEIGRHLQKLEAEKKKTSSFSAVKSVQSRNNNDIHDTQNNSGNKSTSAEDMLSEMQIYTERTDIHVHSEKDVGLFFDFNTALLPEGLAGTIGDEFSLTKTKKMLVRSAAFRVMSKCRAMGEDDGYKPGTTVILGGSAPGSGRSAALNYIAAWARSRSDEWLSVFVPDAERFPQSGKRIIRSQRHPELFTQPDLQREFFSELLRNQEAVLARLPLRTQSQEMKTLRDLVQYAAETPDTDDLVFDVFDELREVRDCRVMVAIDCYNVCSRVSAYSDPDTGAQLQAANLALVRCLMDLYDKPPVNGITIAAMTTTAEVPPTAQLKRTADDSKDIVTLPVYSATEFQTVIAHWMKSDWLLDIPDDLDVFKKYVSALSGRNPREVVRVLKSL